MSELVKFFHAPHPFSQWHPCTVIYTDIRYGNAEQAMMHHKALLMGDEDTAEEIMKTKIPQKIKAWGRRVKNFDPELWDKEKEQLVYEINMAKFGQNQAIKTILLRTGTKTIVEASPYDRIWGIGLSEEDPRSDDPRLWKGQNLLGKVLMRVRDDLK